MKESKDRTEQFMYSAASAATQAPSSPLSDFHLILTVAEPLSAFLDSVLYSSQRSDPMGDGSLSRFDVKGKGRAQQNGDVLALDLGSAEEGLGSQGAFMQMQMVEQQVRQLSLIIYFAIQQKYPGFLHPIAFNCNRIHRGNYRRARSDIYSTCQHGCGAEGNRTAY